MKLTNASQIIEKFRQSFDPEEARDVKAVIQYRISGDGGGDWNIVLENGTCKIEEGTHNSPNVTLKMSERTWLGLVNGTVNPMAAFTTGRLRVSGDKTLAQRISAIFHV